MLLAGIRGKGPGVHSPPKTCGDKLRGHDGRCWTLICVEVYFAYENPTAPVSEQRVDLSKKECYTFSSKEYNY